MHYAMRAITDPRLVVSAARAEYGRQPCVAVSKGTVVEVYGPGLSLADVIYPNGYVTLVVPVVFRGARRLLLVCKEGAYAIMGEGNAVVRGRMPQAIPYTRCVRAPRSLVFVASDGGVAVASVGDTGLVFAEDARDFGYYKILDCFASKNDVVFLLEDISGDVLYSRYAVGGGKGGMVLKEKAVLRKGIVCARAMEDGLVLIGSGRMYYYSRGKFVFESEFANPRVASAMACGKDVLLGMEDGEIIRVSLERDGVGRPPGGESEAGHGGASLRIEVLGMVDGPASALVHLEGDQYYVGSCSGSSYHLRIGKEMEVLKVFENSPLPGCLSHAGASLRYITRDSLKKVTYAADLCADWTHNASKAVRRFAVLKDVLVVSCRNEGQVLWTSKDARRSFDEILNIHVDKCCYFNTRDHVFCLRGEDILELGVEGIVLSCYDKDLCIVFTQDRALKAICLKTMTCIRSVECAYEASILHLHTHLFVSTYHDELVIMDRCLRVVHKRRERTLKSACSAGNRMFFGDMSGAGYEAICRGDGEERDWELLVLKPLFLLDSMVEALVPAGEYIMGVGESTVVVDLKDSLSYRCSMEGISHAFFGDQLYVSAGKSIHRCRLEALPKIRVGTEDILREMEPKSGYVLKFSCTGHGKEVVGVVNPIISIGSDATVNSYLTMRVGRHTSNLFLPGEIVMDGRFLSPRYFVVPSNLCREGSLSKLSMFSTGGNRMRIAYESTGEGVVYALDGSGDYLVTHRGCNLHVYKRQSKILVELCVAKMDFVPYRIVTDGSRIACSCMYRSFGMLTFNQETNYISLDRLFEGKEQIESMMLTEEGLIAASSDGKVMFLDGNGHRESFLLGDTVTSMCRGSLSLDQSDSIYFTTRSGGLGILTRLRVAPEDLGLLLALESHANRRTPFPRDCGGPVIDINMINSMSDSDLEGFVASTAQDRDRVAMVLDSVNGLY